MAIKAHPEVNEIELGDLIGRQSERVADVLGVVLGRPPRFHGALYAPLALLDPSLLLRVAADHAQWHEGRRWGGMASAAAILLFFALVGAVAARRGRA